MCQIVDLNHSEKGFQGFISHIGDDKALQKKLMSLGLRRGQPISVLHKRRDGVVVLSQGNRVALGSRIAAQVFLKPVTA